MALDGLDAAANKLLEAFAQGGREAVDELARASNAVVPYDQGGLAVSQKKSFDHTGDGWEGAVSYDTPYAARQHEERTWRHDPGRTADYLGGPMRANANHYQQHIADKVREASGE